MAGGFPSFEMAPRRAAQSRPMAGPGPGRAEGTRSERGLREGPRVSAQELRVDLRATLPLFII